MKLRLKLLLGGFVAIVFSALIPLYFSIQYQKGIIEKTLQDQLKAVVSSGVLSIDGDLHDLIEYTEAEEDFAIKEFNTILQKLISIKKVNSLKSPVYTMRPYNENELEFVVMTDKDETGNYFTGNLYRIREFQRKVFKGQTTSSGIYDDGEGAWISAAAPIKDSENNIVGILQADFEISSYFQELDKHIYSLCEIFFLSAAFCLSIIYFLVKRISRPLKELTEATVGISKGNLDVKLDIKSNDEIGTLANNFITMKEAILKNESQLLVREAEAINAKEEALRAKVKAEEASHAKSEFLSVMRHEIRTPINAVITSAELLNETSLNLEQVELLNVLKKSANKQLVIMNDILEFTRLDSNSLTLEENFFDLYDLVNEINTIQSKYASKKSLEFSITVAKNVPQNLMSDPVRIRKLLLNITNNSIKFTEQGSISVNISIKNNNLLIVIEDTGIGISKDKIKDIFSPFKQGDNSTSRKYEGTGIGLAICIKSINLMKGTIEIQSEEDKGTTVKIALPVKFNKKVSKASTGLVMKNELLKDETNSKETADKDKVSEPKNDDKIILLVEDNKTNQLVAKKLIKKYGYTVVQAENGQEALEKIKENKIDLVLMDCMMPIMDGYESTKRIREGKLLPPDIPIIALSANSSEEEINLCFESGMNDFIEKPASRGKFDTLFEKWLSEAS